MTDDRDTHDHLLRSLLLTGYWISQTSGFGMIFLLLLYFFEKNRKDYIDKTMPKAWLQDMGSRPALGNGIKGGPTIKKLSQRLKIIYIMVFDKDNLYLVMFLSTK